MFSLRPTSLFTYRVRPVRLKRQSFLVGHFVCPSLKDLPMKEEWKKIEEYPCYDVSNYGNVRSWIKKGRYGGKEERPRILITFPDRNDYMSVSLYSKNKPKRQFIHRLVLKEFSCVKHSEKYHTCHGDGNPKNNHISNLRWGTAKENQHDRIKHGTSNRGEGCGMSKLTELQVLEIRDELKKGTKQKYIARKFGVLQNTISRIKNKKRWGWL